MTHSLDAPTMTPSEAFYVSRRVYFDSKLCGIDSYHYQLFHGDAEREGDPLRGSTWFGDGVQNRLSYVVNAHDLAPVRSPTLSFVVHSHLLSLFQSAGLVDSREVKIRKCCEIPFSMGDFSHWQRLAIPASEELGLHALRKAKAISHWQGRIPEQKELMTHSAFVHCRENADFFEAELSVEESTSEESIMLSKQGLDSYGIIESGSGYIMSPSAFSAVHHLFRRPFFYFKAIKFAAKSIVSVQSID